MGQVVNMMKYDQAANLANAAPTPLSLNACPLVFHQLDDGVMGGRSITNLEVMNTIDGIVLFSGDINTNGGGFASIRSPLDNSIPHDAKGIKLKVRKVNMQFFPIELVIVLMQILISISFAFIYLNLVQRRW